MRVRWLLALSLLGCGPRAATPVLPAAGPERPAPPAAAQRRPVELTVVEDPARDRWRLRYRLREPAPGLRFLANRNRYRAERWQPVGEARWVTDGEYEELHADAPTTEFEIELATMVDPLPKDYELNLAFTDGSRLLYTGHLLAVPVVGDPQEAIAGYRFHFETVQGRDIRVLDDHAEQALVWDQPWEDGEGTYVYFGNIEPLKGEGFTAIVDPGMPTWLVEATRTFVPELFAFYAADVGTQLPFEPLLLVSWGGGARSGRSSGGGAVPGALQLAASGQGFVEASPRSLVHWRHFLAHEVFHLWNAQTFVVGEPNEEEWLPEGSAEYFAERALLATGTIDAAELARRAVEKANVCLTELDGAPLLGRDPPRFDAFYPCGWAIMAAADRAAKRHDMTLGDIMAAAFARAEHNASGTYGTADFLAALHTPPLDAAFAGKVDTLLHEGHPTAADEAFAALLGEVGLVAPGAATLDLYSFMKRLAAQLVRCDCPQYTPARLGNEAVVVAPHESCNAFAGGATVTHVAGFRVLSQAPQAYQALLRAAARGRKTTLTLADRGKVRLTCRDGAPPRSFTRLLLAQ